MPLMKKDLTLVKSEIEDLLTESALACATLEVNDENIDFIKNSTHCVITASGIPLLSCGPHDDVETLDAAKRLIASADFRKLVGYLFNDPLAEITINFTSGAELFTKGDYNCISSKKQGVGVIDGDSGDVQAIALVNRDDLGLGLCVMNGCMKALQPNAKNLSQYLDIEYSNPDPILTSKDISRVLGLEMSKTPS